MKKQSFKNLWTLENVRQIKADFLAAKQDDYLCHASHLFEKIWAHHQEKIKKLAKAFDGDGDVLFGLKWGCLFYGMASHRKTRLAFLNFEIKRLKNNQIATKKP